MLWPLKSGTAIACLIAQDLVQTRTAGAFACISDGILFTCLIVILVEALSGMLKSQIGKNQAVHLSS